MQNQEGNTNWSFPYKIKNHKDFKLEGSLGIIHVKHHFPLYFIKMEIGAQRSQVVCPRWQIELMAEPEFGPSRMGKEAQAFESAVWGRIVYLKLHIVIPLKESFLFK